MEERCQVKGAALRIEKATYSEQEGETSDGCPLAKYVIRRYVCKVKGLSHDLLMYVPN